MPALDPNSWCVLRIAGSRTLPLFRSLDAAGVDAWTPIGVAHKRKGRCRARVDVPAAIMPTFVFVRASHAEELVRWEVSPTSPHPAFSLFRYNGRVVVVHDRELNHLRTEEGRAVLAQRRKERHVFKRGQAVSVPDGPFAGMSGVIEDGGNGKMALVCFGEWRVKIATFLLAGDGVANDQSIETAPIRTA